MIMGISVGVTFILVIIVCAILVNMNFSTIVNYRCCYQCHCRYHDQYAASVDYACQHWDLLDFVLNESLVVGTA